ncbi:MAG: peptidase domain-containing ABC transporter [Magnetococcales bacterium]|nr:peptidase domain-containing ABC transporter [Magnetococcales bacterium]
MSPFLSALRCFFLVCQHHGIEVTPERFMGAHEDDIIGSVLSLMHDVGLQGKLLKNRKWDDLASLGTAYPVMVEHKSGHWVIVASAVDAADGSVSAAVMDPRSEQAGLVLVPRQLFEEQWNGSILLIKREYNLDDEPRTFDLRWFLPEIMKNAKYFRDIIVAATMINLLSFVMPLSFQIMLDKVVPHQSHQTLFTLTIILVIATVFDGLFTYVRQMLMIYATNKIDAQLIVRTFEHLLRLPMPFFESMPTGVLIRHMQQTESIRGFLTGGLFHTLLDASALPLLLVGLTLYSGSLTLVVLLFTVAIAAIIGLMIPAFKKRLEQLYIAEGSRNADLVETVHGMRAVKSLALEPLRKATWDRKVANCIEQRTSVGQFGAIAATLTHMLQGLMGLTVLSLGIFLVFDGDLSIGALVAFNMLSGRVTGPLVQIVGLINQYQQTALSVQMLGHVMNYPPERDPNQRGIRPTITGQIEFQDVTFRYDKSATPALRGVSFRVEEGQMIGVVGRSGSGKTTITRLIQSIHTAQEGMILLDGNDIRHFELPHLRRSIGVVLQDNILFRGTVRDNIAAAKPDASLLEVIEAAKLAGADEFIDRLSHSYETPVEEGASNFSGGQRQRIAIARALLLSPRLLIFDEATSALDPESEAIIRHSLSKISSGRTMIIVSHRLSSLTSTDAILVLDKGEVVDFAPHEVLLERCKIYRHLWDQQNSF